MPYPTSPHAFYCPNSYLDMKIRQQILLRKSSLTRKLKPRPVLITLLITTATIMLPNICRVAIMAWHYFRFALQVSFLGQSWRGSSNLRNAPFMEEVRSPQKVKQKPVKILKALAQHGHCCLWSNPPSVG